MVEIKRPVFLSGENPAMTLFVPGTEQVAAVASYWHCVDSPRGIGHALVLWLAEGTSLATDKGGIFSDNLDLARILVEELTQHFQEFRDVPVGSLACADARCEDTFDGACYRAVCQTPKTRIEVEWADILDRKQISWPRFPAGKAAYDLTTVICPCRSGRIRIDGRLLEGEVKTAQTADGHLSSTAFMAFAETWVGPLDEKNGEFS
jgi:hypothetical protein